MRLSLIAIIGGLLLVSAVPSRAETGGCIKYGAAGAIAGHAVGHGVKGAVAGCVTGMVVRRQARKNARARAEQARLAAQRRGNPSQIGQAAARTNPSSSGGQFQTSTPR